MAITQLSVFVENRKGALVEVTKLLSKGGIDIKALSLADTQDFGILRLIVNDIENAKNVLKQKNCIISVNDVLGVMVPNRPGGLSEILELLEKHSINIEYMYAFITVTGQNACVVLRVENNEVAEKILTESGVKILEKGDRY